MDDEDQFTLELHHNLKPNSSFSAEIINPSMELLDNMGSAMDQHLDSDSNINLHGFMPLSSDNICDHHQRHQNHIDFMAFTNNSNIQTLFHTDDHHAPFYDPITHFLPMGLEVPSLGVESSSAHVFGSGFIRENKINRNDHAYRGKKRKRNVDREEEKPREVVHVRARRGEATDSHSLAERLRREKINEKLRCLQDLVPGCYKTMGMSVMLDVIINYVRSLHNQIEFLSMKLSAASMFYDFNSSEMETMDMMKATNGYETQVMFGEGYGAGLPHQFPSTWPL